MPDNFCSRIRTCVGKVLSRGSTIDPNVETHGISVRYITWWNVSDKNLMGFDHCKIRRVFRKPLFHKMTCFVLSLYRALQRRPFISTCTRWVVLERRKKRVPNTHSLIHLIHLESVRLRRDFAEFKLSFQQFICNHNYSVVFPVRCSRDFMTFCAFIKCKIPMNVNVYLSHVRAEKSLQSLYTFCTVISKHRKYFHNFNIKGTIYFVFYIW